MIIKDIQEYIKSLSIKWINNDYIFILIPYWNRCSHWESNPRPTAYKAGALPTEL